MAKRTPLGDLLGLSNRAKKAIAKKVAKTAKTTKSTGTPKTTTKGTTTTKTTTKGTSTGKKTTKGTSTGKTKIAPENWADKVSKYAGVAGLGATGLAGIVNAFRNKDGNPQGEDVTSIESGTGAKSPEETPSNSPEVDAVGGIAAKMNASNYDSYIEKQLKDPNSAMNAARNRAGSNLQYERNQLNAYNANPDERRAYGSGDAATDNAYKLYQRGIITKDQLPEHLTRGSIEQNGVAGLHGGVVNMPQGISPAYQQGQNGIINPRQAENNLIQGQALSAQNAQEFSNSPQGAYEQFLQDMAGGGQPQDQMSQTLSPMNPNVPKGMVSDADLARGALGNIRKKGFYPDGTPIEENGAEQGFDWQATVNDFGQGADDLIRGGRAVKAIANGGGMAAGRAALSGAPMGVLGKLGMGYQLGTSAWDTGKELYSGERAKLYGNGAGARAAGAAEASINALSGGAWDVVRGNFDSDYAKHNNVNLDPYGTGQLTEKIGNVAGRMFESGADRTARGNQEQSANLQANMSSAQRKYMDDLEANGEFVPNSQKLKQIFKQKNIR